MRTFPAAPTYSIEALLAEGFSRRVIRYYIERGILPPPEGGRGPNAYYTDAHLVILREIKRWRDNRRTLDDLREFLHDKYPAFYKRARRGVPAYD